jgi:KDO2-lipid IV(A) lauroyltransferase
MPRPDLQGLSARVVVRVLGGVTAVLRALPSRWVLAAADRIGDAWYLFGPRARRVGFANLALAFGDDTPRSEHRRILRASLRQSVRSALLLLHASPLTRERLARWVDVPSEAETMFQNSSRGGSRGGVVVSAHVGNWELLLGLCDYFPGLPRVMFLVEPLSVPGLDRFVNSLRGTGGGAAALRRGGARALHSHVRAGGAAALLADRNVRRAHGGIWVPFFGLPARTTPLPAWLALRNDVALRVVLCLPTANGRYRIEVGEELNQGVDAPDERAALLAITTRVNRALEAAIRRHPGAWNWTLKRFKSRPERALGGYPAYSLWDP